MINMLITAGSMTAVAAVAGSGMVFLGAMCVGILKNLGLHA